MGIMETIISLGLFFLSVTIPALQDKSDLKPVSADAARELLIGNCEEGTVTQPSNAGFEGVKGTAYRACYLPDHELRYTRDGEELVGWWHLTGYASGVAICRGPDPARAPCRNLKQRGKKYYGIGASSGKARYEFQIVAEA